MAKCFKIKRIFLLMSTAGMLSFSGQIMAAAFQLWEQDGASVGNYHAGRAAIAEDASTAFYNPAGLVRIHNQQLVIAADPILTNFLFNGTLNVSTLGTGPQPVRAQGGGFNIVPSGHYAAPLLDNLVFGLSVVSPFGLKTDYGSTTMLRYAATLTSVRVVDVSPAFGLAFNDKFSLGAGVDFEHLNGEFDLTAVLFSPILETGSQNTASSNAVGFHLGGLYQYSEQTRVGLTYHSKVTHHLQGKSVFTGPLAINIDENIEGPQYSGQLRTHATLPATTTLSLFHAFNCRWDLMATVAYTEWSVLKDLVLENVAGIQDGANTNSLVVDIPQRYRNTWNYSLGANYHVNESVMLRSGIGYDETPSNNRYRNVQLPDSDRIAVALGGHFQATKTIGLDVGWTHIFAMNTRINNLSQSFGDQTTVTNGSVSGSADVYGLQMTWDIV